MAGRFGGSEVMDPMTTVFLVFIGIAVVIALIVLSDQGLKRKH
jgi:hypothetical protein